MIKTGNFHIFIITISVYWLILNPGPFTYNVKLQKAKDSIFSDIESLHLFAGIHTLHFGYHRLLAKRFPLNPARPVKFYGIEKRSGFNWVRSCLIIGNIEESIHCPNNYPAFESV